MSECLKGIYKQKKFAMLRVIELDMPLLQVKPVCEKKSQVKVTVGPRTGHKAPEEK